MLPLAVVSGLAGGLLFLYQVRTSWVGFLMGAAVLLLLLRPSLRRAHLRFAAVAMAIAIMMPSAWKALDRDRVAGSMDEIHTFGVLLNQPGAIVNEAFRPKPAAPPPSTPTAIPISKTEEKPVAAIEEKPLIETQASLGTSRTRLWMWGDMITELKNDGTWVLGVPMGKPWLPPRIVPWWNLKVTKRIDPHNSFLAMLYRTGIFGLGAFGVIVLSVIIRAIRAARKLPEDSVDRLLVAAAVAGAVYCLGHAATDVTFENPFKGLFVWLMLGVASALTREN